MIHSQKKRLCLVLALAMVLMLLPHTGWAFEKQMPDDGQSTRNLALYRAAYHSSAVDYNQTGHLVTDGILPKEAEEEAARASDQYGDSPSGERPEGAFDKLTETKWLTFHHAAWLQMELPQGEAKRAVSYAITSGEDVPNRDPRDWVVQGSNDGVTFEDLDSRVGETWESRNQTKTYSIQNPGEYRYYRLNITANAGGAELQLSEFDLLDEAGTSILPALNLPFESCWISEEAGEQWVAVDLGADSLLSQVDIHWGEQYAAQYDIQISDDGQQWTTVESKQNGTGGVESIPMEDAAGRYIRLLCKEAVGQQYAVEELEVYGQNDLHYSVGELPNPEEDGTQYLRGGNWKVQRASEVPVDGQDLSEAGFDDSAWLPATVPGTVLTSYLHAGAVPDPTYGDWQLQLSDSYFTADFWYRNHFAIPESRRGQRVWLNFDAINWKADVYFNGTQVGSIEGGFTRGKFDVTDLVRYGEENYLAVLIHKNAHPGNVTVATEDGPGNIGGVIGRDAPTYGPSLGWDWMPTIRGRNIGIYNDVFLSYTQDVRLVDPWVVTHLDVENKDFSKAGLTVKTEVSNTQDHPVTAVVSGSIEPAGVPFSQQVELGAYETKQVDIGVTLENPRLWWPNTYGEQYLYTAHVEVQVDGEQSDTEEFSFGVRELTYDTGNPLTIYCNGTRIVCRGGNWGMPDLNLDVTDEEYDTKIRLHKEANFTMIRNWVGQTNQPGFYEACDKYGILVWDDFWMAGCGMPDLPDDPRMYLNNVEDKIRNLRRHPCLALYCGANESTPHQTIDDGIRERLSELDPTRHYISHSATGTVSGYGPYGVRDPRYYFNNTPVTLQSERGMPNIPVVETIQAMMPEENTWPYNSMWALHDFSLQWNQDGAGYLKAMENYGGYEDLEEFVANAQMVGYENHKAMFEAVYAAGSNGMLMWMSQSAWPSFVWQSYDYYHDVNGAYFGIKTANQPVNAIWNAASNDILLSNATGQDLQDLQVQVDLFNLYGEKIDSHTLTQDIAADSTQTLFTLAFPKDTDIQFIRTRVSDGSGEQLAENFYWTNTRSYQDYTDLGELPQVDVSGWVEEQTKEGDTLFYRVKIANTSDQPALLIRLKVMDDQTGERVLPVFYEDNYFSLMPGEEKEVTVEFDEASLQGGAPQIEVEGFNVRHAVLDQDGVPYAVAGPSIQIDGQRIAQVQPGQLTASVEVAAYEEVEVNITPVIALYHQGRLMDISANAQSIRLDAGEKCTLTTDAITVPEGEDLSGYQVKAYCLGGSGFAQPMTTVRELTEWEAPLPDNLALTGTATASSVDSGATDGRVVTPDKAVDGDFDTRWSSEFEDNQWLMLDLGEEKTFSQALISWEAAYASQYRIEVSDDGEHWTTVARREDRAGGVDSFSFPETSGRYVRLFCEKRGTDWGISIWEFGLYA